ncbi:MAG: pyridoxamine 5'-phosphate oxidase family protein [Gammaproteobacteria bacterium]
MPVTQYDIAPLKGDSLWGFLEHAKTMRLAVAVNDGPIEISPVWYVSHEESVYFMIDPTVGDPGRSTTPQSRLLPGLDEGGRISAVIDDGEDLSNFRGVQIAGAAKPVVDPELIDELLDLSLEKYFYIGHPHLEHYLSQGMIDERRWFELIPTQIDAWDRRFLPQAPIMEIKKFPPHLRSGT